MIFSPTRLAGAFVIDLDPHADERGHFARLFCEGEFAAHGLRPAVAQANVASNLRRGTLRGMHFQYPPSAESKYVRCTRGSVWDIIIDLRPESATYLQHVAVELSAANQCGLYVPERFAHGYQTLQDDTDTIYFMGAAHAPARAGGLMHDDPALGLAWPLPVQVISDKDRSWPLLRAIGPDLARRMAP